MSVLDFLSNDGMSFNYDKVHGGNNGFIYQNQLPEKLIEQYEKRLKDKDTEIEFLKQLLGKK